MHFEIEGRNGAALRSFYSELFGWEVDTSAQAHYGVVQRDGNVNAAGVGIGGAVSDVPETPSSTWRGPSRSEGYEGHVTIYVEVPDVDAALTRVESLGGTRMLGPDEVMETGVQVAKFTDPEGHLMGLVRSASSP